MTGIQFLAGAMMGIFLFTTTFRPGLGPTQPPIQRVPGALTPAVKQGHEAVHSPPPSAKIKNVWSYNSTPPLCLHGVMLS
jgi:hypothetical protein